VGVITAADIITAIDEEMSATGLLLYPNPTSGSLFVDATALASMASSKGRLEVYNSLGQIIYQHEWIPGQSFTLQTGGWQAGIYQFVFRTDTFRMVKQVIKQ
jgi:hypothetical protein